MKIINPATEQLLVEIEEDTIETVELKFQQLKKGQKIWSKKSVAQRIETIEQFYILLEENKDKLANTLTAEMGKPLQQAHNEINGARGRIKYFIDNAANYLKEEWITETGATKEKIIYEALGVIANISAWNYPYLVGVNVFIPALIGGNAVLYKPSEYALLTGLLIQDLLHKAGVPADCFQTVVGGGAVGEMLLNLNLDGYYFTGSYKTGKYIAERVAGKMVPCQLELGGKDPLYIMDDVADIEKAAADALEGVVYNSGQSCCAVERIYVHEKIYDKFIQSYVGLCKKLVVGNPLDKLTDIGPLSRKEQQQFLLSQVEDAVNKGAKILHGGKIVQGNGYYFEPTVLVNVNHGMLIMTEESFGPIVGIQSVANDEEAIQLMQDTRYGLTAAVFSSNYERAEAVMEKLDTGTVYWNCCDRVSATLPWSGRGHSGFGATLSYIGIRAFVQPKAYHIRG